MESGVKRGAEVAVEAPKCGATPKAPPPRKASTGPAIAPAAPNAAYCPRRQTTSRPRLSMEECLPQELLEAVLGLMDRATLCTARLVSKAFCAAVSAHICSWTLTNPSQAVSRHRFSRLASVTVFNSYEGNLAQVDPSLRDLITRLVIVGCHTHMKETLSQVALMPKLRELGVCADMEGMAALLSHCTNLERITLPAPECTPSVLTMLASIASLTELSFCGIDSPYTEEVDPWGPPSGTSWLTHATALRSLQALSVTAPSDALPLIGNLTGLTQLHWSCYDPLRSAYSIAPLTCLTKLRSLCLRSAMSEANAEVACSLGSGALVSLSLEASDGCGRFLARQTALTQLSLDGELCNLRHIGALRLESLQSVSLNDLRPGSVAAEGVAALHKASSLTSLSIGIGKGHGGTQLPSLPLSQALAGLTQLRSLWMTSKAGVRGADPDAKPLDYAVALRPLTRLRDLTVCRGQFDDGDLRAVSVLTGLQVLYLASDCLTVDAVPELGVLTNLKALMIHGCGVTSLAPVSKAVNPLRHARGWPPLDASPK